MTSITTHTDFYQLFTDLIESAPEFSSRWSYISGVFVGLKYAALTSEQTDQLLSAFEDFNNLAGGSAALPPSPVKKG